MCKGSGAEASIDHLKNKRGTTEKGMQSMKKTALGVEIWVLGMSQTRWSC